MVIVLKPTEWALANLRFSLPAADIESAQGARGERAKVLTTPCCISRNYWAYLHSILQGSFALWCAVGLGCGSGFLLRVKTLHLASPTTLPTNLLRSCLRQCSYGWPGVLARLALRLPGNDLGCAPSSRSMARVVGLARSRSLADSAAQAP